MILSMSLLQFYLLVQQNMWQEDLNSLLVDLMCVLINKLSYSHIIIYITILFEYHFF